MSDSLSVSNVVARLNADRQFLLESADSTDTSERHLRAVREAHARANRCLADLIEFFRPAIIDHLRRIILQTRELQSHEEDIIQEVWISLAHHHEKLDADNLEGLLRVTAYWRACDFLRKMYLGPRSTGGRRRFNTFANPLHLTAVQERTQTLELAAESETLIEERAVEEALIKVPKYFRDLVIRRYAFGEQIRFKSPAVQRKLYRCLEQFRTALRNNDDLRDRFFGFVVCRLRRMAHRLRVDVEEALATIEAWYTSCRCSDSTAYDCYCAVRDSCDTLKDDTTPGELRLLMNRLVQQACGLPAGSID